MDELIRIFSITFKGGLEVSILIVSVTSYLMTRDLHELIKPFYIGLAASVLASMVMILLTPFGMGAENGLVKLDLITILALMLVSMMIAYRCEDLDSHGRISGLIGIAMKIGIAFFSSVLILSTAMRVLLPMLTPSIAEGKLLVLSLGGFGLMLAMVAAFLSVKMGRQIRLGLFTLPTLLLFIAAIKILGSPGLIPSLQAIITKILHDIFHWFIVLLLLPDHPFLSSSVWNFIGIFMRKEIDLTLALIMLTIPPIILLVRIWRKPIPKLPDVKKAAERRKLIAGIIKEKRMKSVPAIACIALIILSGYGTADQKYSIYDPEAEPAVASDGFIAIPLQNISDGKLHRYSYATKDKDVINFLVMKKPDGEMAVTLDYCSICEPKGYAQLGRDLFCKYCGTPIPISSVGRAGGCNPIPVPFHVIDSTLRISAEELLIRYRRIKR